MIRPWFVVAALFAAIPVAAQPASTVEQQVRVVEAHYNAAYAANDPHPAEIRNASRFGGAR